MLADRRQKLRAIIFDLDGTLVDSAVDILQCLQATLAHFGLMPVVEPDASCVGPPLADILRRLVPELDAGSIERAMVYFRQMYRDSGFAESHAYPGVLDLLACLRNDNIACFIATNKPRHLAASLLQKTGLAAFFTDWRCIGDDGAATKVELVQALLQAHHLDPAQTAIVGDAGSDIAAGNYYSLYTIAHLGGYGNRQELLACQPDAVVETMPALMPLLQQMAGG